MIHWRYSTRVDIEEPLERLFDRFLVMGLDEDFAWVLLLEGHGCSNLYLVLFVVCLIVVGCLVEDGHDHFVFFALLASDIEHLKVSA